MELNEPILVLPAFRTVNARLLELLTSLEPHEWTLPTIHAKRNVKDLVAHMVDTGLRRLSIQRDGWQAMQDGPRIESYQGLIDFIQAMNREWMDAARRLSPKILIDLTERYDAELVELLESIGPDEPAIFSVAWAGEDRSAHWFDVAREYTEKWHHQQQLRDATGRPALYEPELLGPLLDTFARGLPHALRDADASAGTSVEIRIEGPTPRTWTLRRGPDVWRLFGNRDTAPATVVTVDADRAWRMWTKGLTAEETRAAARVEGNPAFAAPVLSFTAIMA